jgi:P27 family predicted phage terminase small subunit
MKNIERPTPPVEVKNDKVALKAWNRICDCLEANNNLAKSDYDLIELYARTYSRWQRAELELLTQPLTVLSDANGRTFAHPLCAIINDALSKLNTMLDRLGLTPSKRQKRKADDGEDWDGVPLV